LTLLIPLSVIRLAAAHERGGGRAWCQFNSHWLMTNMRN
jgi:hypothetical protein